MSIVETVTKFNDFLQASLDNTMGAVQKIHQTAVEIPIDIGKELGLSKEKADLVKSVHERILVNTYGGARNAQVGFGKLIVQQVEELSTLVNELTSGGRDQADVGAKKPPVRRKTRKSVAADPGAK